MSKGKQLAHLQPQQILEKRFFAALSALKPKEGEKKQKKEEK